MESLNSAPCAIITGAAQRLGQAIAERLFSRGCNLLLHYRHSQLAAESLAQSFNQRRRQSAITLCAELSDSNTAQRLRQTALDTFGRIDYLINNASLFYPTPIERLKATELQQFLQINAIAPAKLAMCCASDLSQQGGSVVNLLDIYASTGLASYSAYVAAKAALAQLTRDLATQLAPTVRVNGVSPGAILWPSDQAEATSTELERRRHIVAQTAVKRLGEPRHIAATVAYLALDASYTSGAVIRVDGGRQDYI